MSLKTTVTKEIKDAIKSGKAWTAYRPFIPRSYERIGAFFCRSSLHSGKRPAKYVSYSTAISGRVVLCEKCYKSFGKTCG